MRGNVEIILRGDHRTEEQYLPYGGPTVGAKAIGKQEHVISVNLELDIMNILFLLRHIFFIFSLHFYFMFLWFNQPVCGF